ncbi:MAG: CDP-glycerol glycerophosphotransferase family protein [Candidatus Avispirillum sp.]
MKRIIDAVVRRIIWGVCFFLPVRKNRIFVSSYYGRGYGDNLKYIADRLCGKDVEVIWLVKNEKEAKTLPEWIKPCKADTAKAIYYTTTAGVWLDNNRKAFFYKKKRQLYIQTWHGGGAQKRCELDAVDKLEPYYIKMAKKDAANTDLMISESRFMTDLYHRSFWYDGPVYECGYPRYDILLDHGEELRQKVYGYYGIDTEKELVLYAPTFRADKSFDAYNIDFERLRENLKKRFGREYVILVHLHPIVANIEGGITYDGVNVINSTFYPDTQELIAVASVLIGDYSSINYDFSLKKQPVLRYASDLAQYRNDRDLYYPFDEYPYPCALNNDELEELILDFDSEKYISGLNSFFDELGSVICPGASDKIAELILDYIRSESKAEFFEKNRDKFIY